MMDDHSVVIIGLGPKGLYCLERLLAEYASSSLSHPLNIHVVNRTATFGCSPVYDISQQDYILMNISVGEINIWGEHSRHTIVSKKQTFVSWYNARFNPKKPIIGHEYLSRAIVGRYLNEGFELLKRELPIGVSLKCHVGEASNIIADKGAYLVTINTAAEGSKLIQVDKILLATGHGRPQLNEEGQGYLNFAKLHRSSTFIPFAYPVAKKMQEVAVGDTVAMKGIGLTFIDAVLELTEGRGGNFKKQANGEFKYFPSGNEPKCIYPFSRTGLPVLPKSDVLPDSLKPLMFFTTEKLQLLSEKSLQHNQKLNFKTDLWYLFELEMELAYYQVAMGKGEWRNRLASCHDNGMAMRAVIKAFLQQHPNQKPLNFDEIVYPSKGKNVKSASDYNNFIMDYLNEEVVRAYQGQEKSPTKAAIEIWFEVRYALGSIMQFGGLTPESHQWLHEHFFSPLKRVVFGPPIINIEKILSLIKAGFIDFSAAINPEIHVNNQAACFELHCKALSNQAIKVKSLIDTRYPEVSISQDNAPLIKNLFNNGIIRLFENKSTLDGKESYYPGAIDMTLGSQFVIDKQGVANKDITIIGIPSESNTLGNLTLAPGDYPAFWAKQLIAQFKQQQKTTRLDADSGRYDVNTADLVN